MFIKRYWSDALYRPQRAGDPVLHEYSLYVLDKDGSHVATSIEFEEVDDKAAVAFANEQAPFLPKELWSRRGLIGRLSPLAHAARPTHGMLPAAPPEIRHALAAAA